MFNVLSLCNGGNCVPTLYITIIIIAYKIQALYYNKSANKNISCFEEGEKIIIKDKFTKNWHEETIIEKLE